MRSKCFKKLSILASCHASEEETDAHEVDKRLRAACLARFTPF